MKSSLVSPILKRAAFVYKQQKPKSIIFLGLGFFLWLFTCSNSRIAVRPPRNVMVIYTKGSYRANVAHKRPQSFQDMLKLLRWYNAGDLVWQYAASSLIDTTRMILCRTDTIECVKLARSLGISSIMYRPEANLLAEEGTFENRRTMMSNITNDILNRDIPILFVGIGTQGEFSRKKEALDMDPNGSIELSANDYNASIEGKRMLRKLEEMKMPLLMRGNFSTQIARLSGMSRAISCGCPSLLINENRNMGRDVAVKFESLRKRANDTMLRVAINIKPALTKLLEMYLKLAERYPNSIFFVQESNDVRILRDHGVDFHRVHAAMSYESWKEKLCSMDISVGSRIHGNMAALGCEEAVPAVVVAADHRVLELSKEMRIPHLTIYNKIFRDDDWLGRILNEISFNGESFDLNRCEKASIYVRVFEAHHLKPSYKLRRIADSCAHH